jgi:hypothetical protein
MKFMEVIRRTSYDPASIPFSLDHVGRPHVEAHGCFFALYGDLTDGTMLEPGH